MKFDIKYLPSELDSEGRCIPVNADDIRREVEDCIRTACMGDSWLKEHPPELDWYLTVMPHEIQPDADILKVLSKASDAVMGGHMISGLPSGADARHLQNNGGIPTVLFGPGSMKNAHSIDEHVDVEEYMNCIKVLACTIAKWTE